MIVLGYRSDIDGLRAIAVLAVIAFHVGIPGLSGGFVGVDIFFVISGYLITGLLWRELHDKGRIDFGSFFARRCRRLMPAMMVVIVVTLLAAYFVLLPDAQNRLGREVRSVVTLSANHHFFTHAFDYFDAETDLRPMLHTWSLAVEEQFYLLWPFLLWGVFRLVPQGSQRRRQRAVLLLLLLVSFGLCVAMSWRSQPWAFYLMPARAWEFAAGGLLALAPPRRVSRHIAAAAAFAGLGLMLGSILYFDEKMLFPGYMAVLPVAGAVLFLLGGQLDVQNPVSAFMSRKLWTSLGLLSYGWYLWHWPLLALGRAWDLGARNLPRDFLLGAVLSLLLAWLSLKFVETPVRERRWPWSQSDRLSLRMALLVTVSLWLGGTVSMYLPKAHPWGPQKEALHAKLDRVSLSGCMEQQGGTPISSIPACSVGQGDLPNLLLWGDSHADHLLPSITEEVKNYRIKILVRVAHGCPPFDDAVSYKNGEYRIHCSEHAKSIWKELGQPSISKVSGVIVNAFWMSYIPRLYAGRQVFSTLVPTKIYDFSQSSPLIDRNMALDTMRNALTEMAERLREKGLRLVLVAPEPVMPWPVPECVARRGEQSCNLPREEVEKQRKDVLQIMQSLAQRFDNVRIWDPLAAFCDAKLCYGSRNGQVLYRDTNHLTATFARSLAPSLAPFMPWLLQRDKPGAEAGITQASH